MTEWISVETELPSFVKYVLGYGPQGVSTVHYTPDGWYDSHREKYPYVITHWQSLPPPPKKKRWVPKNGDTYFYIDNLEGIKGNILVTDFFEGHRNCLTGFYQTREEAEEMLDKIKAFVTEQIGEP